jgi:hypothetical protein
VQQQKVLVQAQALVLVQVQAPVQELLPQLKVKCWQ